MIEHNHISENNYPKQIPLMSSNEKLKCHKVPYVPKSHVPNKHIHPEEYAHHMLFMYFSFKDENELKYSNIYIDNLNLPNVLETVNLNGIKVEPYAALVEDALERLATNQEFNIDPLGQQENEEVSDRLNVDLQNLNNNESFVEDDVIHVDIVLGCSGSPFLLYQNSVISENIHSLKVACRVKTNIT